MTEEKGTHNAGRAEAAEARVAEIARLKDRSAEAREKGTHNAGKAGLPKTECLRFPHPERPGAPRPRRRKHAAPRKQRRPKPGVPRGPPARRSGSLGAEVGRSPCVGRAAAVRREGLLRPPESAGPRPARSQRATHVRGSVGRAEIARLRKSGPRSGKQGTRNHRPAPPWLESIRRRIAPPRAREHPTSDSQATRGRTAPPGLKTPNAGPPQLRPGNTRPRETAIARRRTAPPRAREHGSGFSLCGSGSGPRRVPPPSCVRPSPPRSGAAAAPCWRRGG